MRDRDTSENVYRTFIFVIKILILKLFSVK